MNVFWLLVLSFYKLQCQNFKKMSFTRYSCHIVSYLYRFHRVTSIVFLSCILWMFPTYDISSKREAFKGIERIGTKYFNSIIKQWNTIHQCLPSFLISGSNPEACCSTIFRYPSILWSRTLNKTIEPYWKTTMKQQSLPLKLAPKPWQEKHSIDLQWASNSSNHAQANLNFVGMIH